jgi:hypothetical protein
VQGTKRLKIDKNKKSADRWTRRITASSADRKLRQIGTAIVELQVAKLERLQTKINRTGVLAKASSSSR